MDLLPPEIIIQIASFLDVQAIFRARGASGRMRGVIDQNFDEFWPQFDGNLREKFLRRGPEYIIQFLRLGPKSSQIIDLISRFGGPGRCARAIERNRSDPTLIGMFGAFRGIKPWVEYAQQSGQISINVLVDLACSGGHVDIVKYLLQNGAALPDGNDVHNRGLLHENTIIYYLENGIPVNKNFAAGVMCIKKSNLGIKTLIKSSSQEELRDYQYNIIYHAPDEIIEEFVGREDFDWDFAVELAVTWGNENCIHHRYECWKKHQIVVAETHA